MIQYLRGKRDKAHADIRAKEFATRTRGLIYAYIHTVECPWPPRCHIGT